MKLTTDSGRDQALLVVWASLYLEAGGIFVPGREPEPQSALLVLKTQLPAGTLCGLVWSSRWVDKLADAVQIEVASEYPEDVKAKVNKICTSRSVTGVLLLTYLIWRLKHVSEVGPPVEGDRDVTVPDILTFLDDMLLRDFVCMTGRSSQTPRQISDLSRWTAPSPSYAALAERSPVDVEQIYTPKKARSSPKGPPLDEILDALNDAEKRTNYLEKEAQTADDFLFAWRQTAASLTGCSGLGDFDLICRLRESHVERGMRLEEATSRVSALQRIVVNLEHRLADSETKTRRMEDLTQRKKAKEDRVSAIRDTKVRELQQQLLLEQTQTAQIGRLRENIERLETEVLEAKQRERWSSRFGDCDDQTLRRHLTIKEKEIERIMCEKTALEVKFSSLSTKLEARGSLLREKYRNSVTSVEKENRGSVDAAGRVVALLETARKDIKKWEEFAELFTAMAEGEEPANAVRAAMRRLSKVFGQTAAGKRAGSVYAKLNDDSQGPPKKRPVR